MAREWRARLRLKPGSITQDGGIVSAVEMGTLPGRTLYYGSIWIAKHRLFAAENYGWRVIPGIRDPRGELVAVEK